MSYCGYVTTVKELRKHSNADRLQVATLFGNDVIVGLDVKVGDLGVYFPTDGKLSVEFATENNLVRISGSNEGGYLDPEKRHITSLKLRGEKSDGLFLSVNSLSKFTDVTKLKEGDNISTINGVLICEKYVPKGKAKGGTVSTKGNAKKKENLYPLFEQHIDTAQLAYNTNRFKEGDQCVITLKMHGTSQRTTNTIKKETSKLRDLLKKVGIKLPKQNKWELATGTRRVNLESFDGGFYGGNQFRKQWHDLFEGKLKKGETIFYEVVGYTEDGGLIMPECDNKKTRDKEFIKQYGDKTRFTYGCAVGQSDIYAYRMTMTNEDGYVVEYPTDLVKIRCEQMGVKYTPELDRFTYTTNNDLLERVAKYEDGVDPIGKTHLREGIIVRIEGKEKFTALKHKNFNFKVLEGIIKSDDVLDMEEAESAE